MPQLFIALIVVFGGLWVIRKAARMQPAQSRAFSRKAGGAAMVAFAGLLALRGRTNIAATLLALGLGLIGIGGNFTSPFGRARKAEGQKSSVSTALLTMELDHDSGTMQGIIRAGSLRGRDLAGLAPDELKTFYHQCEQAPDQSLDLFEAWLDRHHPNWREEWQARSEGPRGGSSAMTVEEALAVLGLKEGATKQDIKHAHRSLMKDFHPDRGGSDYLAAKINQAKDVLLQD
jgi:hypothetical protein